MIKERQIPVLFVMGPTAAGKTGLSINLAKRYTGEIISSDSMQIYQGFSIGTAKASPEEQGEIPHHLLDMIAPDGTYSVAEYQADALQVIGEIQSKVHTPIVVGGTGLYTQSLLYELDFSNSVRNDALRKGLEEKTTECLYAELTDLDPAAKDRIHPNNRKRVIRALEILKSQGKRSTESFRKPREDFPAVLIGVNFRDRDRLYDRINRRVDEMMEAGWVQEVEALMENGVDKEVQAFQAIGYPEILKMIEGELSREEAVEKIKQNTRRYAKRQMTWYRRESNIRWFYWEDYDEHPDRLFDAVYQWIEQQYPKIPKEGMS